MKHILLNFLLICSFSVIAQTDPSWSDLKPCGSQPNDNTWLRDVKAQISRGADTTYYIPLSIHVLGDDAGKNYFAAYRIYDALCQLNKDFVTSNLQFYIKDKLLYHNDTKYYTHKNEREGAKMMFKYNIDSTLNCYIVGDPGGNCGYNLPYAGIALSKNCTGVGSHTWAHEMGHALSLQHPFLGWEAKTWNPNLPTPTKVTYNYTYFKEFYFAKDTVIIDTALVELVDNSNCLKAADKICDTKPDYISVRWNCDAQGLSPITYKDPNGTTFKADGTLIMSYSNDACQTRFSEQERLQMRKMLLLKRPYWAGKKLGGTPISGTVALISPITDQIVQYNNVKLNWAELANAQFYQVQVSRLSTFGLLDVDTIVNAKTLTFSKFQNNRSYYWRVQPLSNWGACTTYSDKGTFKTSDFVGTKDFDANTKINVYPTLISDKQSLHIDIQSVDSQTFNIQLFDISGKQIFENKILENVSNIDFEIQTNTMAKGIYFLKINGLNGQYVQRLMLL